MAGSVTIPGANGTTITITAGTSTNLFLASIIRNSILIAAAHGGVSYGTSSVNSSTGQVSLSAPSGPNPIAVIPPNASGTVVIPPGYAYVIDTSTSPQTLTGTGNVQIVSNDTSGGSYRLSGHVSLSAAVGSGKTLTASIGGSSSTYDIAIGGSGSDSVNATGQGTLAGGTGSNTFIVTDTASSGSLVMSNGTDSVLASGDRVSIVATGSKSTLNAGSATTVLVQETGSGDTLFGGIGTTTVEASTGGSNAFVVGGAGALVVDDSGKADTIVASSAAASIAAWGKDAMIFAGSNSKGTLVTLSGGLTNAQGANTVVGGTGPTTVTLGTVDVNGTVLGSGHNVVIGGPGKLVTSDSGFSDTVAVFSATAPSVFAAGQSGLFIGGTNNFFASLGGGGAGPNGSDNTVVGGTGNMTVSASGINDMILGGTGSLSVQGAGGSGDTIAAFAASSANITLANEGSGGALVFGGSNAFNVTVKDVANTIIGGASSTNRINITSLGITATDNLVFGGSGALTVNDDGRLDTIAAFSAASAQVSLGGSRALFVGGSHNGTVVDDGANDTVLGTSGLLTVSAAGGSSGLVVFGGVGNLDIAGTVAATVQAYTGTVSLTGGDDLVYGAGTLSSASIKDYGVHDTIVAGAGTTSVIAGSGSSGLALLGGSGTLVFTGGGSPVTVFGSSGVASITGGAGGTTLFGAANGTSYFFGSTGALMFVAGAGNETLDAAGSAAGNYFAAGSDSLGQNSLVGGSGSDTFTAGAGTDTMTSGSGNNAFVFFKQATDGKSDVITNWTTNDSLFLNGYSPTVTAATLLANATSGPSGLTLLLSDNTTITFSNLTSSTKSELQNHILYSGSS